MYYWFNLPTRLKEDLKIEELPCCGFVEEYNKKLETLEWGNLTITLNKLVKILQSEVCYAQDMEEFRTFYWWNLPAKVSKLTEFVKTLTCTP